MCSPNFKLIDVLELPESNLDAIKKATSGDVPVVIRGVDIGSCCGKWSPEYLMTHLKQPASIHVSSSPVFSFLDKNFKYKTMNLDDMIWKASQNSEEKYYLRSLGKNARSDPSNFMKDYPNISNDFKPPPFLLDDSNIDVHSSILRIASHDLTLWTHYDVYDNILVQVKGKKSVILFPPSDAKNLYVVGDKSLIPHFNCAMDILIQKYPLVKYLNGHQVVLDEGDILYIPNYWWHSITSLTFSVGINIFWSNPELKELYDKKDVYGNKDPIPAAIASVCLEKCIHSLKKLPEKHRKFYASLFLEKLQKLAD